MPHDDDIIKRQMEYYDARANEYNDWFFRRGRYDRGEKHRAKWFAEIETVREALRQSRPRGKILEFACGTGLWTELLAPSAKKLTALDSSAKALAICKDRVKSDNVEYILGDIFDWKPEEKYEFVFFGFWLSHVPESKFDSFWKSVADSLAPDGTVFFLDSRFTRESTATDHAPLKRDGIVSRKLDDGTEYEIIKHFHDPESLTKRLCNFGWKCDIRTTDEFFIYGNLKNRSNRKSGQIKCVKSPPHYR